VFGDCEQASGDAWRDMGVFVGVYVRYVDARAPEFLDLCRGFECDLSHVDAAGVEIAHEVDEAAAEVDGI